MDIQSLTIVIAEPAAAGTRGHAVAQYGRRGGTPSCGGAELLTTLKSAIRDGRIDELRTKCLGSRFVTRSRAREIVQNPATSSAGVAALDPDTGPGILRVLLDAEIGLALTDDYGFAADSLSCEWCYVVDLNAERLEVYGGFNTHRLESVDRFADLERTRRPSSIYHPVRLLRSFSLRELDNVSPSDFAPSLAKRDAARGSASQHQQAA